MKSIHLLPAIFFLSLLSVISCSAGHKKKKETNVSGITFYDLAHPVKQVNLPPELNEISGIIYSQKEQALYAIEDEDGLLFKISLQGNAKPVSWRFGKEGDYEDLCFHDNRFYVLKSNGKITSFELQGNEVKDIQEFKLEEKGNKEFESLYFDPGKNKLIMVCKDCEGEKKSQLSGWSLDPASGKFEPVNYPESSDAKLHFKPSAVAIRPETKELYILASVEKLLLVADPSGKIKNSYNLDPTLFKQPEGLTFLPSGQMIVSNESANQGSATLLIYKNK
jgi:uncharacterized protein YjiK